MSGKRYFAEDAKEKGKFHLPSGSVVQLESGTFLVHGLLGKVRLSMDDVRGLGMLAALHSPTLRG